MDNPFNSTSVNNFTYPNASDPNFYGTSNPTKNPVGFDYHSNKYIIIGCVLGGFFLILLCIALAIAIKLLNQAKRKRELKEKNWAIIQNSEYPDNKLQHSLFDSSFTIAVQEAAKIPETPKSTKSSGNFNFGKENAEKP